MFLKLVLHGLAADWKVDKDLLMADLTSSPPDVNDQLETSVSNSEEDILTHEAERHVPFQRTPSPLLSPDLCYASADSLLSSVGEFFCYFHCFYLLRIYALLVADL